MVPSFHLELRHHFKVNEDRQMDILSIFNRENIQSSLTISKLIDLVAKLKLFHEFSILEMVSKQSHIHCVGKKAFSKCTLPQVRVFTCFFASIIINKYTFKIRMVGGSTEDLNRFSSVVFLHRLPESFRP